MVIWGTDVVVVECREKFMKFITEYICSEFDPEGIYFYVLSRKSSIYENMSAFFWDADIFVKSVVVVLSLFQVM